MSVITARGKAAKESATKANSSIDFKKVYIRLKDGESVRVRLMSSEDYVEYKAHGSYNLGIWTQACLEPAGKPCALCEAAKTAYSDDIKNLYARKRYLFAMADLNTGELRVFDATKGQATNLIDTIEEYAENLGDVAFTFKRTGNKTETNYSLKPILKPKGDDKEKFAKFDELEVTDEFFEAVLLPRTYEQQVEALTEAGFPVELIGASITENTEKSEDDVKPINATDNQDSVF